MCRPACLELGEIKRAESLGNGGDLHTSLLMASSLVSRLVQTSDVTTTPTQNSWLHGWMWFSMCFFMFFFPACHVFHFSIQKTDISSCSPRLFPAPSDPQWLRAAGEQAAQQILERYRREKKGRLSVGADDFVDLLKIPDVKVRLNFVLEIQAMIISCELL